MPGKLAVMLWVTLKIFMGTKSPAVKEILEDQSVSSDCL